MNKEKSGSGVVELGNNVSCSEEVANYFRSVYIVANRLFINAVDCIRDRVPTPLAPLAIRKIYIEDISISAFGYDGISIDEYKSSIEIIFENFDSKITAFYKEECIDGECNCELLLKDENGKEISLSE